MNHMGTTLKLLALATIAALAAGVASYANARPTTDGNRFEATFVETSASITNRVADLGMFQLINTGSGSVEGYGPATVVLAVSQDRTVQPCGPGSWTNAGLRRVVLADGVLVLREIAFVCQTPSGPQATGTWEVDSASSTGAFAGAVGSGLVSVDIATRTATHTGKLKLARGRD
jgi:hypothetical protein